MARTAAELPAGLRITDYLSLGVAVPLANRIWTLHSREVGVGFSV